MQIIKNGNKIVKIHKQNESYFCLYCQEWQEQAEPRQPHTEVLESKWYSTEKNAVKWAKEKLNIN